MYTFIATTIMGLESVLARELQALGFQTTVLNTKVEFQGDFVDLFRANLWCRTAGRIYIKIATFNATTFDELFDQTYACDWPFWISKEDQFPVSKVSSRKSKLFSKSDCQAIVKKAISKKLQDTYNQKTLPETGSLVPIRIQIENDEVVLSIDSTGAGLNKRGYRAHMSVAPLRETLAAGLILLSRWRAAEDALIDPFCGTGTLLIEAGLIACNIAPGLNRSFISQKFKCIESKYFDTAYEEAHDSILKDVSFRIYGSDINPKVLSIANKNIELAGLSNIFVQKRELQDISSRFDRGKIITNPPYQERLDTPGYDSSEELYKMIGSVFSENFSEWDYGVLSDNEDFEDYFGQKSRKKRKLFNGGIQCRFFQYF
jgi:putative N6-adenine-specific DNA methylase